MCNSKKGDAGMVENVEKNKLEKLESCLSRAKKFNLNVSTEIALAESRKVYSSDPEEQLKLLKIIRAAEQKACSSDPEKQLELLKTLQPEKEVIEVVTDPKILSRM